MMTKPLPSCSLPAGSRWKSWRKLAAGVALALGLAAPAAAQVDTYTLAPSTGTFTPLAGSTVISGMAADTYLSPAIPLGFTFIFDGAPYTSVKAASDGYLTFSSTATTSSLTNNLATGSATNRPLVAPLWDDLDGRPTGATGTGSYLVTGTAPNRVFTFEWKNWEWNYAASSAVISFQVKLYETSNRVEFIYHPEAGGVNSGSASIGLAGIGTGAGSYLSLNGTAATPTASTTIETTSINTKPADGQIYAFTPAPLPACSAPRSLTVANLTSTTADLSWAVGFGTGPFTVEYGAQGFTPGTGTVIPNLTTASRTVTGLTPATAYEFYVTQNCGGTNGNSTRTGPVAFTTRGLPPANDECASAVTLTPGAINAACASATSGTLENALATTGLAAPVGNADDDVWYKFMATSTAHTVTLTGTGDYVQQLLGGSCGALTSIAYSDPNIKTYTSLTIGTMYYLRVYSYSATAQAGTPAQFTVCVTTPTPPPVNDDPCGAIVLPLGATCSPLSATNDLATTTTTNGYSNPGTSCGIATSPKDVWFRVTTAASGLGSTSIAMTVTGAPAGLVRLFSTTNGCSGPFTQVGCFAGTTNNTSAGQGILTGLMPSTTYYVMVAGYGSGDTQGAFTICATVPPTCLAPTALRADTLTTTSAVLKWTSPSGVGPFTLEYGRQGFTPGTGTIIPNITTTRYKVTGLAAGTQYQFYVTQNCGGISGNSSATGPIAFTTLTLPPANDDCANATAVNVEYGTCTAPARAVNSGATTSAGAPAPTCGNYQGGDVWFRVVVPASGVITLETDSVTSSPVRDTGMSVYSGTCGSLTELDCDDDSSPNGLFSLVELTGRTPGEVLYVRVWEYGNDTFGAFKLCARSTSNCPVPMTPSAGSLTGTSAVLSWSVATPTTGATFRVEYGLQGFTLGTGTVVNNISGTSTTITGLTPNATYCFYVRQNCGTSGSSTNVGPTCFTTPNPPASNDEPCNATVLPVGTSCTPLSATTVGATSTPANGYVNPGCSTSLNPRDVWFSMTTPSGTGTQTISITTTGSAAGQVRLFTAASCSTAFTAVSCNAVATGQTVGTFQVSGLQPATRYMVMVAGYGSSDPVGPFTICASRVITSTRSELPGGEVSVFPNPSNMGSLTLRMSGVTQAVSVQATLVNLLGQQVLTQKLAVRGGSLEQQLAVQGLAKGIYNLQVQVGEYTIIRKVVLE
ncbi:T9SS C-terminal target domain-containing protein [Hymenobacter rigui]|uniref:T9SS C-terminal target domain-containing protein n=2 Tax=Hymenobacter rigui TaxID=334424 RepID=A0A3R9P8G8_9BACT|nr:T9SS C-terminal target domain-containing protein [Hymenobacter rigui]